MRSLALTVDTATSTGHGGGYNLVNSLDKFVQ